MARRKTPTAPAPAPAKSTRQRLTAADYRVRGEMTPPNPISGWTSADIQTVIDSQITPKLPKS